MSQAQLHGSVLILILFEVCEEIRLEELRRILGLQPAGREPSFKHPAPEYVRFENPPHAFTVWQPAKLASRTIRIWSSRSSVRLRTSTSSWSSNSIRVGRLSWNFWW